MSASPLQTLPCASLPAGCTSRLPASLDLSWSLFAECGAWGRTDVRIATSAHAGFPHSGLEKSCGRSPLTRYGTLIIVSLECRPLRDVHEPTFLRWVSSTPVPASLTPKDTCTRYEIWTPYKCLSVHPVCVAGGRHLQYRKYCPQNTVLTCCKDAAQLNVRSCFWTGGSMYLHTLHRLSTLFFFCLTFRYYLI